MTTKQCRHRKTWLVCGGYVEWCYQCGAIRPMRQVGANGCAPAGRFVRPVGKDGTNPHDKTKNWYKTEGSK